MFFYLAMIDSVEDQSMFEKVYNTYKGLMFHVAFKILNNEQDAEDAVHNAFVKIAENIQRIEDAVCLKTQSYVVTIAENKAIDLYRMNRRRNEATYIDGISDIIIETQDAHGLEYCILRLSARYREIILLKYYHGFSCKEIAKQLGISEANAIKLDQRAKRKLQQICEEEGVL